jgi:mRNA interferase MazF
MGKRRKGRLVIIRGEIYWVDYHGAVGAEIRKVRPAIVLSNERNNEHRATVTVAPLSSGEANARYDEVQIPAGLIAGGRRCRIKTHQIRAIDKSRLGNRMGRLPRALMPALDASLRTHLGLEADAA